MHLKLFIEENIALFHWNSHQLKTIRATKK